MSQRHAGSAWLVPFVLLITTLNPVTSSADEDAGLCWIWTPEAKQTSTLPDGTRWFRKTFMIDRPIANPVDEATIEITADNSFAVWFNGVEIGTGSEWKQIYRFDIKKHAVHGKNVIAVAKTLMEGLSECATLIRLVIGKGGRVDFNALELGG